MHGHDLHCHIRSVYTANIFWWVIFESIHLFMENGAPRYRAKDFRAQTAKHGIHKLPCVSKLLEPDMNPIEHTVCIIPDSDVQQRSRKPASRRKHCNVCFRSGSNFPRPRLWKTLIPCLTQLKCYVNWQVNQRKSKNIIAFDFYIKRVLW